jgi:hypothetical protein
MQSGINRLLFLNKGSQGAWNEGRTRVRMDLMPLLFHERGSRRVHDFSMGIKVVRVWDDIFPKRVSD